MAFIQLTIKEVEHMAKLAQLRLIDKEKEKFIKQLSSILDYMKQLDSVDTRNVEPINQITGLQNIIRKDEINKEKTIEEKILQCAPDVENNFLKVPSVF